MKSLNEFYPFLGESAKPKVGDWLEQSATGTYAKVTEVRPNGKIKGVKFSTHDGTTFAGNASVAFLQNWHPLGKLVDEKDVPKQVVAKINKKL